MITIIFSSTIIVFTSALEEELPLQIVLTAIGEIMTISALVVFGRQNGIVAYKKTLFNEELRQKDLPLTFEVEHRIGEYATWKGFIIGAITALFFVVLQIIECCVHTVYIDFILQYACAWAVAPFRVAGFESTSPISLTMALLPVVVMGIAYIWGGRKTAQHAQDLKKADEVVKGKRK